MVRTISASVSLVAALIFISSVQGLNSLVSSQSSSRHPNQHQSQSASRHGHSIGGDRGVGHLQRRRPLTVHHHPLSNLRWLRRREQARRNNQSLLVCQMSQNAEHDSHNEKSGEEEGSHKQQQQRRHDSSSSSAPTSSSSSSLPEKTKQQLLEQYEADAERKFKLAKAQADIDKILNNPVDPPFDIEAELKKVAGIAPPDSTHPDSMVLEDQVSSLEEDLYQAVKAQDFKTASEKQQEISQLHVDDCGMVLQINSKFYQAFSRKEWDTMKNVWLPDRSCVCIHPSQKPLLGIRDILTSWQRMFNHASGGFQKSWMEPHQIRLMVKGTMAIVTCEEHVFARRFVRGQKRQTELVNKLQATNVFRKIGNQWYMTYHHSSWHADSESAKLALKAGGTNGGGKGIATKENKDVGIGKKRLVVKGRLSPSDIGEDDAAANLESILGIQNFGPILGDENNDQSGGGKNGPPPVKRIIMGGSLSDILNGDLGDLLSGGGQQGGNNPNIDGVEDGAIIQFHRLEEEDEEEDSDEDDAEDEDGDIEAADAEESVEMLKQWANKSPSSSATDKSNKRPNIPPKKKHDSLRQNCISALRKLTNEGRISAKQKRVLLTDIISCSTKGEYSMVEVAYELLLAESSSSSSSSVGGGADETGSEISDEEADAEEEFADQCRVFAQTFEE